MKTKVKVKKVRLCDIEDCNQDACATFVGHDGIKRVCFGHNRELRAATQFTFRPKHTRKYRYVRTRVDKLEGGDPQ